MSLRGGKFSGDEIHDSDWQSAACRERPSDNFHQVASQVWETSRLILSATCRSMVLQSDNLPRLRLSGASMPRTSVIEKSLVWPAVKTRVP